jgi:hypothetical protein
MNMKRFILYLVRWQLSTPILAPITGMFTNPWLGASLANLIGGAIFFWVDRFIFTSPSLEVWQVKEKGKCDKCGIETNLWRLVKTKDYDRTQAKPVFLCQKCSKEKLQQLKDRGIKSGQKFE